MLALDITTRQYDLDSDERGNSSVFLWGTWVILCERACDFASNQIAAIFLLVLWCIIILDSVLTCHFKRKKLTCKQKDKDIFS